MAEHFISLNCANCGAKLDVYNDMERFSCGYCGTGLLVQRRGGTVALKAVADAIHKVQIGTDKTAAELAISRYEKELEGLNNRTRKLAKDEESTSNVGFGCGSILALVGLGLLSASTWGVGAVLVLIGGLLVWWAAQSYSGSAELRALRGKVRQLQDRIAEKKRIADG